MEHLAIAPERLAERMVAKALNLDAYCWIMDRVRQTDVSQDADFQRIYDYFYRVRRNETWRDAYFTYFEQAKGIPELTFETVLTELFLLTGQIEASFSSKLLATLNPEMPIWDQYVLKNLGMKMPLGGSKDTQLKAAIKLYREICQWYREYLGTEEASVCIHALDKLLPSDVQLSDVKKVDYILWSHR